MLLCDLRHNIQAWHKSGESYRKIGERYGITKTMAWQIERGYRPGKKVSTILNLEPEPDLKYTRSRRERLDQFARYWGYKSWCEYETYILNYGGVNGMRWSRQKPIWNTENVA